MNTIIIGNSPGAFVCAIYLKSANLPLLVINSKEGIEYSCEGVPGVVVNNNFSELSKSQAKNLNIEILEENNLSISIKNDKFVVINSGKEFTSEFLVLEKKSLCAKEITDSKKCFIIEDFMEFNEGIVVAGAGCKVAFEIKELV